MKIGLQGGPVQFLKLSKIAIFNFHKIGSVAGVITVVGKHSVDSLVFESFINKKLTLFSYSSTFTWLSLSIWRCLIWILYVTGLPSCGFVSLSLLYRRELIMTVTLSWTRPFWIFSKLSLFKFASYIIHKRLCSWNPKRRTRRLYRV